jgi:hypothetical protein
MIGWWLGFGMNSRTPVPSSANLEPTVSVGSTFRARAQAY